MMAHVYDLKTFTNHYFKKLLFMHIILSRCHKKCVILKQKFYILKNGSITLLSWALDKAICIPSFVPLEKCLYRPSFCHK